MFCRLFIVLKDKINEINDNIVNWIEVGVISWKWENIVVILGIVVWYVWVFVFII